MKQLQEELCVNFLVRETDKLSKLLVEGNNKIIR